MKRLIACGLLLCALLLSPPAQAAAAPGSAELDAVLAKLTVSAGGINTLASDFVQEKYLAVFKQALTSKGRFYYQKPDRLRWELQAPIVTGFALDGDKGRRWRGKEEKSETFDIRQDPVMKIVAEQLLAWARPDFPWLLAHYKMSVLGTGPIKLRLDPKFETGGIIDHLLIVFAADGRYVAQVELHDRDGDYTRLRFSHTEVNIPLARELF